jgi:hypothetical protein
MQTRLRNCVLRDVTPARVARGYLAFLDHNHTTGAERILGPAGPSIPPLLPHEKRQVAHKSGYK